MVVKEHLVTVGEFDAFMERPENRDRRFGLINGVITEEGTTTEEHGNSTANISLALALYNFTIAVRDIFADPLAE